MKTTTEKRAISFVLPESLISEIKHEAIDRRKSTSRLVEELLAESMRRAAVDRRRGAPGTPAG